MRMSGLRTCRRDRVTGAPGSGAARLAGGLDPVSDEAQVDLHEPGDGWARQRCRGSCASRAKRAWPSVPRGPRSAGSHGAAHASSATAGSVAPSPPARPSATATQRAACLRAQLTADREPARHRTATTRTSTYRLLSQICGPKMLEPQIHPRRGRRALHHGTGSASATARRRRRRRARRGVVGTGVAMTVGVAVARSVSASASRSASASVSAGPTGPIDLHVSLPRQQTDSGSTRRPEFRLARAVYVFVTLGVPEASTISYVVFATPDPPSVAVNVTTTGALARATGTSSDVTGRDTDRPSPPWSTRRQVSREVLRREHELLAIPLPSTGLFAGS